MLESRNKKIYSPLNDIGTIIFMLKNSMVIVCTNSLGIDYLLKYNINYKLLSFYRYIALKNDKTCC